MKQIILLVLSIVGRLFYPFRYVWKKTKMPREVFFSQVSKYDFMHPVPKFVYFTPPLYLIHSKYVLLGEKVRISEYTTISAWPLNKTENKPLITIGNNVRIGAFAHITSMNGIIIEDNVLLGKFVTISDNSHGSNDYSDLDLPPKERKLSSKGKVIIKKNVWVGDKATILPGVCIGEYSIIGANTVVVKNVPPYSIVCGNPGRIVKTINKVIYEES